MCEVLEVMASVILLLGLFYFAWKDYQTQLIAVGPLFFLGVIGIAVRGAWNKDVWIEIVGGVIVGVVLLLTAILTSEQIGLGDGLLFLVTGVYLDLMLNFTLLLGTFILIGVFSTGCLLLKKKGKDDRVAMAPFVLVSYVLFVL